MHNRDYQKNRNPFVDHPEWVVAIYGSTAGEPCVLSQPTIDGESLRFVLQLTVPGRYRLLRSIDLINWMLLKQYLDKSYELGDAQKIKLIALDDDDLKPLWDGEAK